MKIRVEEIIGLCRDCAANVHGARPPNPRYARQVSNLLIGTAATESHFTYNRQGGFSYARNDGAWGLWQTEMGSLESNVLYLHSHDTVRKNAMDWLYRGSVLEEWDAISKSLPEDLCTVAAVWPRFAVLMARLHYFRFSEPIPASIEDHARYWKRYYNTWKGKGTPEKYMADWNRLVAPVLSKMEKMAG